MSGQGDRITSWRRTSAGCGSTRRDGLAYFRDGEKTCAESSFAQQTTFASADYFSDDVRKHRQRGVSIAARHPVYPMTCLRQALVSLRMLCARRGRALADWRAESRGRAGGARVDRTCWDAWFVRRPRRTICTTGNVWNSSLSDTWNFVGQRDVPIDTCR